MNSSSKSEIQAELQQIILDIKGASLRHIPDDLPILDLGVSSLELVEGMRQVYDRFGVLVSIRRIIEGQITLGGLALYIEQELSTRQAPKKKAAQARWTIQRKQALAPSQQHVAFLTRYSPEAAAAYNQSLAVRLHGPLDGPALQAAVEEAGSRYEALRTLLDPEEDLLLVGAGEPLELTVSPVRTEQLAPRMTDLAARPFTPGSRLFRADLLRLADVEHVFVLTGHQLLLDAQALEFILADIGRLYGLFSQDKDAGAAPPVLQWTDYLAMGETNEARTAHQRARAYWQDCFAAGVPRLDLPLDERRPLVKKYSGARLAFELDPSLQPAFDAYFARHGLAASELIMAALVLFVHRISGQASLITGVESEPFYPDTGLPVVAQSRTVLPVLSGFDPQLSFLEWAQGLAQRLRQAQQHRQMSLAELLQLLNLPRDQSRSPLFVSAFRSVRVSEPPVFADLQVTWQSLPASGARYDLDVTAELDDFGVRLVCDYSTEIFKPATLERWLRGVQSLLRAALAEPELRCGWLPVMPEMERHLMESGWNLTEKDFPRQQTVLDHILRQAHSRPESPAVMAAGHTWTYRQLENRIDQFAAALHAQGIRRGGRVAILLRRSGDLIASALAAWRVGALYVPLDIGFPPARLSYMLADAEVEAVLTSHEFTALTPGLTDLRILCVEDLTAETGVDLSGAEPAQGADSAMILFTSGSTGKPKGVEIRHAALLNLLLATRDLLDFQPGQRMLALTTLTFDVSENEVFMPLMAGGSVDIAEDGLTADAARLVVNMAERKPTHMQATPTLMKYLLASGWQGDRDLTLISMGEAISRDLAEELLPKSRQLWNFYGPTETTVYSAYYRVVSLPDQPMRIGRPLPNTQFYILDARLRSLPVGAVGEIYIGGEGLAVGYWRRPELTGERFVTDPFNPGGRLYRTGDLGYYLPDGEIICLGRVDDQVKIHGVRVELGELETVLREQPGVQDAVAAAWKDANGDAQLAAYVISRPGVTVLASELRAGLRQRLPEVMVPPQIIFCSAFPKTANGKIQRSALPVPQSALPAATGRLEDTALSPVEQTIAGVWGGVLGIDPAVISRDADFLDLGGHSLLMTQLMVEVRKLFQVSFTLREFFGASTLRKFAALVDERRQVQASRPEPAPIRSVDRSGDWARQRMAFLTREAELPQYIAPPRGLLYQPGPLERVLLTGATGFLGAYIVAEILKTTSAHLYCLVRPRRGDPGKERIERQMRHYAVWDGSPAWQEAWKTRLHVVDGDITLPRLGMADTVYESLAQEVDGIFHGAAHVNFIYPYEALRATNVLGIHELIQFAFYKRIKPVHHLSTAAIWPMGAEYTFYEKDPIDHNGILNLGYDEAKWVGEKTLLNAAERGLPVARYRPGEVGGDSVTGRCVTDHFLVACVKGFLQFGAFPAMDIQVDVAPVDYVAKAMVHLAFKRNPLGRAFHLTATERRSMGAALALLRENGYRFEEMPFDELRDRLVASPNFASNALFAYQAALEEMDQVSMQLPNYDTREVQRELRGSGIACPAADEKLFTTYLRYLQEIGFIPQPEKIFI